MNWYISVIDPGNAGGSVSIPEPPTCKTKPIIYECPRCDKFFYTPNDRQIHFFEEHPYRNPVILLHNKQLNQTGTIISEPNQETDWLLSDYSQIRLNKEIIEPKDLYKKLATLRQGFYIIELSNLDVFEKFELRFCIPEQGDVLRLEEIFQQLFTDNELTVNDIRNFTELCTSLTTARKYLDGICQYLYGVLAKDQRGNTQISHNKYKERFNQAFENLRYIDRPIAHTIRAIINFSCNRFALPANQQYASKLVTATEFFSKKTEKYTEHKITPVDYNERAHHLPIDYMTSKILDWTQLSKKQVMAELANISCASKNGLWTAEDRTKAMVLWLHWAQSAQMTSEVRSVARSLLNDAIFTVYAEKILESTKK